jgi:histone deacetylase complex regulatory component SIN3
VRIRLLGGLDVTSPEGEPIRFSTPAGVTKTPPGVNSSYATPR